MSANSNRCAKCGKTRADDKNVTFRRFPYPGKDTIEKARAWAKYCWPDDEWSSNSLSALHSTNKVLCGRHFAPSQFMDKKRQMLRKFAVPEDVNIKNSTVLSDCDMTTEYLSDWETLEDLTDAEGAKVVQSDNYQKPVNQEKDLSHIVNEAVTRSQKKEKCGIVQQNNSKLKLTFKTEPKNKLSKQKCKSDQQISNKYNNKYRSDQLQQITKKYIGSQQHNNKYRSDQQISKKYTGNQQYNNNKQISKKYVGNQQCNSKYDDHHDIDSENSFYLSYNQAIKSEEIVNNGEVTLKKVPRARQATRYGACRCCLREDEHGIVDVRSVLHCLNVQPSHVAGLPELVCGGCFSFLEEATRFRDMVINSETMLLQSLHRGTLDGYKDDAHGTTLKIRFVSETGKRKGLTVPVSGLRFNSNGEMVIGAVTTKRASVVKKECISPDSVAVERDMVAIGREHVDNSSLPTGNSNENDSRSEVDSGNDVDIRNDVDSQHELATEDVSVTGDGIHQDMDYSELSDDAEFGMDESKFDAMDTTPLTPSDIFELFKSPGLGKGINTTRNVRENLMTLLENSTILPFTHNSNPMRSNHFECIYFDACFPEFSQLREHMTSHHAEFDRERVLAFLKKLPEIILKADVSRLQCKLCENHFENIDALVAHLVDDHDLDYRNVPSDPPHNILGFDLSGDVVKCSVCEKVFAGIRALLAHMNLHYGAYLCEECGSRFMYAYAYKKHLGFHKKKRPMRAKTVICDSCGESLKNKHEFNLHRKMMHSKASKCSKTPEFVDKKPKKFALAVPSEEDNCQCKVCNAEFGSVNALFVHRMQHLRASKEEVHTCELCGYLTSRKACLGEHFQRHWGIKNYACGVCNQKYVTKKALKFHSRTHLARYQCQYCETCFLSNLDFRLHIKMEHPEVNTFRNQTKRVKM